MGVWLRYIKSTKIYFPNIEYMNLTIHEGSKDFAFLTLITEASQDSILSQAISYHHEKLRVSVTWDKEAISPLELCISTIIVVNNLPQKESQPSIVIALKNKFGDEYIVHTGLDFGNQPNDKQASWCHIYIMP